MSKLIANEMMYNQFKIKRKDFIKVGKDVNYKIYTKDNKVVLVFEQSLDFIDFVNSARFSKVVYKNQQSKIKAMSGFVDAYKSCNDIIMNHFIRICNMFPTYEYIISGFSFGGGLSQLACEDFNFRTRANVKNPNTGLKATVITFGAPRIYDCKNKPEIEDYVKSCTKNIFNFGFIYDKVPKNPPKVLGYKNINLYTVGEKNFLNWIKSINPWYGHRRAYFNRKNYKNIKLPENSIIEV